MNGTQGLSNTELRLGLDKIDSKLKAYEDLPPRVQNLEELIKGDDRLGRKGLLTISEENSEKITEMLTMFRSFKTFAGWTFKVFAVIVTSGFIPFAYITIKRLVT